ncbi:MAG: hypothetical protein IPM69_06065 [Ignavibacteria bacterium]|nr:hypothetical protein [Ignavibacteria bacterium]
MKKIFLVFIVWLSSIPCFAHEPWVHQYIVQEAYRYLEKQVGAIPVLRHYAGIDFYGTNQPYWGPGDVPRPWELELGIPVGVWREDVYDPIWRFSGGYTTISHFWSADNGDDAWTDFTGGITTSNPNAWEKARRFYFGGDRLAGLPRPFSNGTGINLDGDYRYTVSKGKYNKANFIDVSYNSLCDLIANRNSTITAYYYIDLLSASKTTFSQPEDFNSQRSRLLGFHVLGHLLHLLTDGSVPAHTHRDTHVCPIGDGDTYETAMGRNDFIDLGDCTKPQTSFLAQNWTAITAATQGGLLLEVFSMPDEDALRYMFYTMNQLANHFGTNDFAGNDDLPNGSSMLVSARYSLLSTTGTSTYGWQNGTFTNTPFIVNYAGDELMNYAIRVSATMMYWIAIKTGLVGCPTTLYQQSHTYYGVRTASENANFKASSKIIAGRNVHPNLTSSQGNVVVESGTLTYLAGDEIQLRDGFVAKVGSNFHARIENVCPLTTSCINSTSSIQDESIPLVNQGATEKIENFAKKETLLRYNPRVIQSKNVRFIFQMKQ